MKHQDSWQEADADDADDGAPRGRRYKGAMQQLEADADADDAAPRGWRCKGECNILRLMLMMQHSEAGDAKGKSG
eukprot:1160608-Pelagomonas_calceolata.AAC.9